MDMMLARGSCTLDYQVGIRGLKGGSDGKMATNSPDYTNCPRCSGSALASALEGRPVCVKQVAGKRQVARKRKKKRPHGAGEDQACAARLQCAVIVG
ncbi:MAG TPA: hypothetical protein VF573_24810 [Paraburkholderia sp.]|uniref:hypothetical protein n=1 Tax=Paraburkholderia sp. TaxID=1926495 RepID=UPI002ED37D4B